MPRLTYTKGYSEGFSYINSATRAGQREIFIRKPVSTDSSSTKSTTYTLTLQSTSWTSSNGLYVKSVSCPGITANDDVIIDVLPTKSVTNTGSSTSTGSTATNAATALAEWAKIITATTTANAIQFVANAALTNPIAVIVKKV